jgi:pimeloyl-ACP methyl ester carboxylesterase
MDSRSGSVSAPDSGDVPESHEATGGPSVDRRAVLRAGGAVGGTAVLGGAGSALWTDEVVADAVADYPPVGDRVGNRGERVHLLTAGNGPPVVLVHGDGGSVFDWTYSAFDRLAEGYRITAVDRPGFGYSDRPDRLGSPWAQARRLRSTVRRTGIENPVLVGHSRGASVALAYAAAFPAEIAGVVDVAGAPYGTTPPSTYFRALAAPLVGTLFAETFAVPFARGPIADGLRAAFEPEGDAPPDYVDAYVAMERRPGQLRAHAFDAVRGPEGSQEFVRRIHTISAPVAAVHGTADSNVPVAQARRLVASLDRTRAFEVPGAGHELPFFHPERIVEAIEWVLEGD